MNLGFIGTGKISSSIIFGIFKSKLKVRKVYISSRNRSLAKKLSKKYSKIKVLNDNQEIINKSSIVFFRHYSKSRKSNIT
jgi:pyrroline-5-carboxylate reductase